MYDVLILGLILRTKTLAKVPDVAHVNVSADAENKNVANLDNAGFTRTR
jgi:hypothetical protein